MFWRRRNKSEPEAAEEPSAEMAAGSLTVEDPSAGDVPESADQPNVESAPESAANQAVASAPAAEPPAGAPPSFDIGELGEAVVEALQTVYDPEIPVNIYELGLIYDVDIDDAANVKVQMTLTSPHCPVAETLPGDVERAVASAAGVVSAAVEVVWDPAWNPAMMSEAAKLELGFF